METRQAKRFRKTRLSRSIGIAMSAIAGVGMSSGFVSAQEADDNIEQVTVTGSRISRTSNLDTTIPVQVMTAEDIKAVGRFSVADALRNSVSNSFGSTVPASGGTAQSQAEVDLLGVGSDRTLVLLDGRRLPGSPSLGGSSVNINQIPLAMVQSIEILKGGASALYGSDAVAGVVNIKLKEKFEGFEISFNEQDPTDPGGESSDFSLVTGISSDRGNITFAYEHQEQKPIFDKDRPYTAPSVLDTDGDGVFDRNVGVSTFGAAIRNPNTMLWEPSPECDRLTNEVDGFVGVIETTPTSENRYCGFAYAGVSANQASTNRDSIFVNSNYEVNDETTFFMRALFTHNKSFGRYAPPAAFWPGDVPANSANNPYDVAVPGRFRWTGIGNRDNTVDDYSQDYIAGIKGEIFDNVNYEVYYHHNTTDNKSVGGFYLSNSGVAFNLANDIDFGSPEGIRNLKATTLREDFNRFDQYYAGAGFSLGELAGGSIEHYVGVEKIETSYKSTVDAQSEANLVGGSSGNSAGKDREIDAIFYESLIPITSQLEAEFAVRYDDYSDFGSEVSPKIALSYRPITNILLRASWGKGFRAPDLQQLSQATSDSADFAIDYVSCRSLNIPDAECPEDQYNTKRQANPNLGAETSTYINFGVVYENDNVTVAADFFDLNIEDAIRFVPIQDLILGEAAGAPNLNPGFLVIDRSNGIELPTFRTGTINGPGLELRGFTLSTSYGLEVGAAGSLAFNFDTTYFTDWKEDNYAGGPLQNKSGFSLQPQYRAQLTPIWSLGDHSVSWNMDFIPSTSGFETPDPSNQALVIENGSNASFLTHNLTYTYSSDTWGQYRLGLRNLTDKDPILSKDGEYANEYDFLYSAGHIGRVVTVGATWSF